MPAPTAMTVPMTSALAVHAVAQGDREAWQWLCIQHAAEVLAIARRILGSQHAEDACHDVFVRIHANAHRFVPGTDADEHAQAWIRRLALNVCLNLRRSASRQRSQPLPEDALEASTIDSGERAIADAEVLNAIADLPERERNLITMRFWEGLDYRTIAEQLGCSESTARVRLHRCINQLRRRLASVPAWSLVALLGGTGRLVFQDGRDAPATLPTIPSDLSSQLIRIASWAGHAQRRSPMRTLLVTVAWLGAAAGLALTALPVLPVIALHTAPIGRIATSAARSHGTATPIPAPPPGLAERAAAAGLTWIEDPPIRVEYTSVGPKGYELGRVEQSRTVRRVTISWKESIHHGLMDGMIPPIVPQSVDEAVAGFLTLVNVRRAGGKSVLFLPVVPVLDTVCRGEPWLCVCATTRPDGRGIVLVPYHAVEDWYNGPTDHALRFLTTPANPSSFCSYWSAWTVRVDEAVRSGPPPLPCRVAAR